MRERECERLTVLPCVLIICYRSAAEGSLHTDPISIKPESPSFSAVTQDSATAQQRLSSNPAHFTITSSSNPAHCELVSSSSPIMAQRFCSSALIPSHTRDTPAVTTGNREDLGDAHHVKAEPQSCIESTERNTVRNTKSLTYPQAEPPSSCHSYLLVSWYKPQFMFRCLLILPLCAFLWAFSSQLSFILCTFS